MNRFGECGLLNSAAELINMQPGKPQAVQITWSTLMQDAGKEMEKLFSS